MNDFRNFRITLYLTHFFQDHRSLCKIFINEGMKNIRDLENHIQDIFSIKDFYFISHGHYVPPSEDIRILKHDDIVIAIPVHYNNMAICASSTPIGNTVNRTSKEEHTTHYSEEKRIGNRDLGEYANVSIKKKKKRKRTHSNLVYESKQDRSLNKDNNVEHTIGIDNINSNEEKFQTQLANDIAQNKKKRKESNRHAISDLQSSSINNGSVKTKVLYFENQSLNDELVDKSQLSEKASISYNQTESQDHEIRNKNLLLEGKGKPESSSDYIKDKKLVIRKRKSDLISYDLPKKSNIVKSILISSISNIPNVTSESSKCDPSTHQYRNNTQRNDNLLQEKCNIYIKDSTKSGNTEKVFGNVETSSYEMKNNCGATQKQITVNDNSSNTGTLLESSGADITDVVNKRNDLLNPTNIDTIDNSNLHEYNGNTVAIEHTASMPMREVNIIHENSENKLNFVDKNAGNDIVPMKQLAHSSECDSGLSFDVPLFESKLLEDVNVSLEKNILIDDNCSTFTSDNIECDAVSFITKRKRKRSHRKKKSKLSSDSSCISLTTQVDYSKNVLHFLAPSAVHIKFNDEGEPINDKHLKETEDTPEKVTSETEIPGSPIDTTIQATGLDKIESEKLLVQDKCLTNDNRITIDDTIELDDKKSTSDTMLSDDVILKSPLMTSTKPKKGDLIAFKMLRLTENYSPAISKYIIGEILSFNEITTNVDLKIIDGLDQCGEPAGKFSLENGDKEIYSTKSYCWTSLIEPRLIFP